MLGSMVLRVFAQEKLLKLIAVGRKILDAQTASVDLIEKVIRGADWVINNIGIIKPYIRDENPQEVERAVLVNSLFPHRLAIAAERTGSHVLQIATDCVFSGNKGPYGESDLHDAADVYGKSKSLGEARLPYIHHLRCSIIGPEEKSYLSLLEWFRKQPNNAELKGFTNHRWNGVTTLHFAKICLGIILNGLTLRYLQHVVPSDMLTKAELLRGFSKIYKRADLQIKDVEAKTKVDRILKTEDEVFNRTLWSVAGYSQPPHIMQMVQELAQFDLF